MTIEDKLKKGNEASVGVIGSGLMGHGIAYAAALSGFEVLMLDLTRDKAKEGLERIHQILENRFEKDFITKKELEDTKVRIKISTDYETLATKNIIVEAIYEDTAVPEQDEEFIKINEDETINLSDDELDQCRCTSKAA